jgi:3-hydroxy-9,10-secoandrosta-1,3,5(10)-triene-9,17-dione monooxygenase
VLTKTDTVPTPAEIIARTRALIPALAKRAPQGERERRLPKETVADMQAAGLFKVLQPKRWGGYEMDIHTYYEVQMALGEGDMSVAWVYGVVGVHPWAMGLFDERCVQDVWGNDNTTLMCSSLMPVGVSTPVEGGFRLKGHWKYSSGCEHCEWAILGATEPAPLGAPADRRLFLVPKADYQIIDTWHVSGLKSTGSNDIVVKDVFVPAYRTQKYSDNFRGFGAGLSLNTAPLYRLPWGQIFFRGVSTGAIGALQGKLNAYIEYGKARTERLTGQSSASDPVIQITCAKVACGIDEMKTMLHRNFTVLEGYAERGEMPPLALRIEYKFHNAWVAERCTILAAKLFKAVGGNGIYAEQPFGRFLADIMAGRQHVSNQYEQNGKSFGSSLFGVVETKDMVL